MQVMQESVLQNTAKNRADRLIEWLTQYAKKRINSLEMRERRTIPPHIILDFGNQGMMGLQLPVKSGGLELNYQEIIRVLIHLASIDTTLANFVGLQNLLFLSPLLFFKNSHPEIQRYLPAIASGKILGAFAMSEASSGSNPHEILACAKKIKGGFLLSAHKRWVGSAAWSGLILVFAKVEKEVNTTLSPSGMTAFLVKTESAGVKIGEEALTFGINALIQSDLTLENVFVPDSMVIGHIGRGFEIAAKAMMLTRVAVAAAAIGAMRRGLQIAEQFTKHRKIGSVTLADFETTSLFLQKIAADILLLERTIAVIAKKLDQEDSIPNEVYTALKYVSAEWSWQAIDTVMQSLGARGYLESNPVAQLLADVRLFRIFEGTSETMVDFLGKRALNSTLSPDLLQETERTRGIGTPTLIQEFEEFLLSMREKNHQSTSNVQAGTINSQVAGRLLSILIIENILLESFKEDSDFYLKDILLNRLKDHFLREKQAFTNPFSQAISSHTHSLISKVLVDFPILDQTASHPRKTYDIV